MNIVEEVTRRRQTIALDRPERVYSEIRDLLDRRMSFDDVIEEKYFNDVEEGVIRSRIITKEWYDRYTREEIEVYLYISKPTRELDIQLKAKLVTHYPDEGWKDSLWYYAYRSIYEKFLYGQVRHEFEHAVEEKAEELMHRIRDNVEAKAENG